MSYNPNKLTFKVNEVTGEIIQPQVFLCDRQLKTLGEIYPVNNLRIKANLNGADEVSFSTVRHNTENHCYDAIRDYSIVFVRGFGYFEVSPTVSDTFTKTKNVQGSSLGEAELSQLLCTLECNTEDDIKYSEGRNYIPTILYNPGDKDHSLIHRILSDCAPNYEVGHVDETIRSIQRTFSFSKTDVISCFNQIAEEIGCIFDVVVTRDDNRNVSRLVNIYDAENIGEDTNIQLSTNNLSDEITLSSDGNMKNCFIVEGGDEIVTSTVEGIMPSGNNKLYKFSEETRLSFSGELRAAYEEYEKNYEKNKDSYAETLELEYGIFDLILYLQSGRMPTAETADRNLRDETIHVIYQFQKLFKDGLGTLDLTDTKSRNSTVRQIFSLFVDDGYAVKQTDGAMNKKENGSLYWTGDIVVYEIGNNDSNATIHVGKDSSYIEWMDKTTSNGVLTSSDNTEKTNNLSKWGINFTTDDDKYETYLKQKIAITQKNYEHIEDQGLNNPKEWQRYSLNRLYSYYSGYESCIEILREAKKESGLDGVQSTADNIISSYLERIKEISDYMSHLEEMIYYLYFYYDQEFDSPVSPAPSGQDINYAKYNVPDNRQHFNKDISTAFENMVHYIKWGTWVGGEEKKSTDHPLYCGDCGSKYVTLLNCLNPGCGSKNIVTYSTLATMIKNAYQEDPASLEIKRKEIRKKCDIKSNLGDKLYSELCSFIREDIYTNSNFVSNGLSNSALIARAKELVEKANNELAKACVSQHTLSGNVYAFVAYSKLDKNDFPIQNAYDKFKLGNFMRYFSDNQEYKLRLSSEEFIWSDSGAELNVEFTDIVRYSDGEISDIASLVQAVGNLATSFDSVKKQAEQGAEIKNTFETIKNEGLYSSLSNAINARNMDVQIDDKGITLRKFDYELDDYSLYQMKLINRNIVMTKNNWKSADLAIGLGYYGGELKYGVWADVLIGNMIVGEELVIQNNKEKEKSTVLINGDGIKVGSLDKENPGVCVEINPNDNYVLNIFKRDDTGNTNNILYVDNEGNSKFEGEVNASGVFGGEIHADSGNIGLFEITENNLSYNDGNPLHTLMLSSSGFSIGNGDIFTPKTSITSGDIEISMKYMHTVLGNRNRKEGNMEDLSLFFEEKMGGGFNGVAAKYYKSTEFNGAGIISKWYAEKSDGTGLAGVLNSTFSIHAGEIILKPDNGKMSDTNKEFFIDSSGIDLTGLDLKSDSKIEATNLVSKYINNTSGIYTTGYLDVRCENNEGVFLTNSYKKSDNSITYSIIRLVDGKVELETNVHIPYNCYIGGESYNYAKLINYNVDIYSLFKVPSSQFVLQRLGRIIVFSVILNISEILTNYHIGTIPFGYRPAYLDIAISADNYTSCGECSVMKDGSIMFSCNNIGGYRIHGVWFTNDVGKLSNGGVFS